LKPLNSRRQAAAADKEAAAGLATAEQSGSEGRFKAREVTKVNRVQRLYAVEFPEPK